MTTHREIEALPAVLRLAELAALLRCSPKTIRRRLADGVFPLAPLPRVDRTWRWATADVRRFLERGGTVPRGGRRVA